MHSVPHGSPTRVYLNQRVTPHLLEAMKHLATAEPEKPLKWLSEFLAMKSEEIEG
jgi:COMPASS component SDC1